MHHFLVRTCCLSLGLLFLSFVQPALCADSEALSDLKELSGELNIVGRAAHNPIMQEAAVRIMDINPNIHISVSDVRTREGLQKLNAEQADIFHTDRPVSAADKQEYGLQSVLFAIDGIAAAVHSNNPVQDLSPGQLQDIFAADISCWAEVGGEQGEVNIYTREEGSGSTSTFRKQALNGGYIADSAREVDSCGRMKQAVSRDSQAIGYVRIPRLDKSIAPVALNGVRPEAENILDCSYPVKEHFYMYTREQTRPLTRSFIEYILGTEGAQLIRERGFIPAEQ